MTFASVDALLVSPGAKVGPGQAILELAVDLSDQFAHDCAPISYYRVCAGESAWLREASNNVGEKLPVGALLARFSTTPDEALGSASRALRTTIVGITRTSLEW